MFNPQFNLKRAKAVSSVIVLLIKKDNKRVNIFTKLSVPTALWNENTQTVREYREYPAHKRINKKLKEIRELVINAYDFFDNQGIDPTAIQIRDKFFELRDNPKKLVSATHFWEIFEEFIAFKKLELSKKSADVYEQVEKTFDLTPLRRFNLTPHSPV